MQKWNLLLYNITEHSSQPPACDKLCSVIIKADRKEICRFSIFRKLDFTDPKGPEQKYLVRACTLSSCVLIFFKGILRWLGHLIHPHIKVDRLRTPLRVIAGRLELSSWNYLSLLLNRSTDRPTHFREDGGDGRGGGGLETYLRGNLFMLWD